MIEFRQFVILVQHVGLSKGLKSLINTNVPNLHDFDDISDFILCETKASESDIEDTDAQITLSGNYVGRGNKVRKVSKKVADAKENDDDAVASAEIRHRSQQRAIRLHEIGPRMTLELTKIQKEFCDGEVLFHHLLNKTPEQVKQLEDLKLQRAQIKASRKQLQQENLQRKKNALEAKRGKRRQRKEDAPESEETENNIDSHPNDVLDSSLDEIDATASENEEETLQPLKMKRATPDKSKRVGRIYAKARKTRLPIG